MQPDKAALLSAGPVLVHVTLKSKLARLLSIYPILKPKIQAWTLYKDHKFLHQFVEFCCEKCTHFCVVRFPINLCINLSNFVVSDVYSLLLKTNPGDFHPKKNPEPKSEYRSCVVCCLPCKYTGPVLSAVCYAKLHSVDICAKGRQQITQDRRTP